MSKPSVLMSKPSVFVGSSSEGLRVAREIQLQLADVGEVERWDEEGVFALGTGTLESLVQALNRLDFAVFVLTPDDLIVSRGTQQNSARDNVLIEFGLFTGRLGRERTFLVCCKDDKIKIPSDLAGITFATYSKPSDDSKLTSAVGPACTKIRNAIERQGKAAGLQKLKHEVQQQKSDIRAIELQINAIKIALEGVITRFEYDKLVGLDNDGPFMCSFHDNLPSEMKRLYDHEFVAETEHGSGPQLENYRHSNQPFDLKKYYVLADRGKTYLQLRREWQNSL